jgi:hypothetical protein
MSTTFVVGKYQALAVFARPERTAKSKKPQTLRFSKELFRDIFALSLRTSTSSCHNLRRFVGLSRLRTLIYGCCGARMIEVSHLRLAKAAASVLMGAGTSS